MEVHGGGRGGAYCPKAVCIHPSTVTCVHHTCFLTEFGIEESMIERQVGCSALAKKQLYATWWLGALLEDVSWPMWLAMAACIQPTDKEDKGARANLIDGSAIETGELQSCLLVSGHLRSL